ncbi:MAG: tRNA pseudouridine(55) synthase TruB [Bryobacteraceae bacterium]
MKGLIVVDKPAGWTSHDVVNRVRRLVNTRKVGHLGTLDPMATGVLPLVIGRATRLAQFFQHSDKVYDAAIRFGCSTDTYDRFGTPLGPEVPVQLDCFDLEQIIHRFRGKIEQMPPAFSAKKIAGTPAHRLMRKNVPVDLKPVQVEIFSFDLIQCSGAEAQVRVHCSAGTYLRSIAHDLGQGLGCGACLIELRRTSSGGFDLGMARTIDDLNTLAESGRIEEAIIPSAQLLPQFPSELVDTSTAGFIRQGRDFRVSPFRARGVTRYVKAVTQDGELIAIGEAKLPNLYHPILVL